MSGAGSFVDLDQQIISNTTINGRLIPTAEVTSLREQTTKARITEIYLFFKKTNFFARYFGLQYKPSSGAERKRKVRNIKGSLQRRFKI